VGQKRKTKKKLSHARRFSGCMNNQVIPPTRSRNLQFGVQYELRESNSLYETGWCVLFNETFGCSDYTVAVVD
jgi:hypothetical protein